MNGVSRARRGRLYVAALLTAATFVALVFWQAMHGTESDRGSDAPASASVDRIFAAWDRPDSPGCAVGVSRNGEVLYERGYGLANLELGVPMTPASVFHVASVAKQFTAVSIVLLAQRGLLSIDDEVRRYITELPEHRGRLTIRHLLTHTGGLRDVFLLRELAAPRADGGNPNHALVELIARQRGLNFGPGSEFQYSNSGYILLATIVRRVSGASLREFAAANIFEPLGMTHTHVHDDPALVVPNRAYGYALVEGDVRVAVRADPGGVVGNTGVFTTVGDLLRWERNFAEVRVGTPAWISAMQTPAPLTSGATIPYGFGLAIGEHRGLRTVGHGGNDPGYAAQVVRYPDRELAIAVLCNLESIDATTLAREVAEVYLADVGTAAGTRTASQPAVTLTAAQLERKAGLYRDPANEFLLRVFVRDGKLTGSAGAGMEGGWELTAVDPHRFVIPGTRIVLEFVSDSKGNVQRLRVIGERPTPEVFERLERFALTNRELSAYAGQYTSPELDVTYTVTPRDSSLVLLSPGRAAIVLEPVFPDGFAGSLVGVAKFSRRADGVVTGFTVNTSGVRGLHVERVTR